MRKIQAIEVCANCAHRAANGQLDDMTELDHPVYCETHATEFQLGLDEWQDAMGWDNIFIAERSEQIECERFDTCQLCDSGCREYRIELYCL